MIKPKQGYCTECGNTEPIPIIKDKCQYHYWQGKRKRIAVKPVLIKPISDSQSKRLAEYRKVRDEFMKTKNVCEVFGCYNKPTDLHHKKPRAYHLCDVSIFMAVCRPCHTKIESEDSWARENGYKLNHL
jgi:hypothetical protein